MKICIYCGREAIRVTSFTTGCCRDARKVWALEQVNEAEQQVSVTVEPYEDEQMLLRRTLDEVKAPDDRIEGAPPTSINRRILLLADQRNKARGEVQAAADAIDFATNGCPDSLPERIAGMCQTIRHVVAQRDDLQKRLKAEDEVTERMLQIIAASRGGWEALNNYYEEARPRSGVILKILKSSSACPPGWHGR